MLPRAVGVSYWSVRILTRTPFPGRPSAVLSCALSPCRGLNAKWGGSGAICKCSSFPPVWGHGTFSPWAVVNRDAPGLLEHPQNPSLQPVIYPTASDSSSPSHTKRLLLTFLKAISSLLPHLYTNGLMGTIKWGWNSCQISSSSATKHS